MKKMLVVAAVLAALVSVGSYQAIAGDAETAQAEQAKTGKYVCKHCKEYANEPGKCPKCGMEMKKNSSPATQPSAKNGKKPAAE